MPNNILITPGSASIQFSGSAANTIRLQVEPSGGVSFYGNSGSLLGITDNLSGSLMSVNDVSGFSILEVFSDDRVVMGTFNRNTLVVTGSRVAIGKKNPTTTFDISGSTSITGSLEVTGQLIGTASVATSASFAATSSFALNTGGAGFPFSGSAAITGSLVVSGSGLVFQVSGSASVRDNFVVNGSTLVADAGNNRVGIGLVNPATTLQVQGNISASSYTSSLNNQVGFFGTSSWATSASFLVGFPQYSASVQQQLDTLSNTSNISKLILMGF